MISSGIAAIVTTSAAPVTLIDPAGTPYNYAVIDNEGAAGFFSVDGGNVWGRLPASQVTTWRGKSSSPLLIKRDGDTDLSGVYGFADWQSSGGNG